MTQLHQIRLQYDAQEDRRLLRISTQARQEFRFWLTRRFVKLLWPVLMRLLESHEQVRSQSDSHAKKAVLSFQHQSALDQSDFSTAYREQGLQRPLGEAPVLLAKIQVKSGSGGNQILCLHPLEGQGVELALTQVLLHSLCKLVADTVRTARWDLCVEVTEPSPQDAPQPGERRLN